MKNCHNHALSLGWHYGTSAKCQRHVQIYLLYQVVHLTLHIIDWG